MRVLVFVKATEESEQGIMPTQDLLEAMTRYNEQLVGAGIMVGGDGLKPSSKGVRIGFDGDKRIVIDGPFAETKELVAGFWIWEVRDLEEAKDWARRCPNPMPGPSELEIRPVVEMADFGDAMTPDIVAREDKLRDQLSGR